MPVRPIRMHPPRREDHARPVRIEPCANRKSFRWIRSCSRRGKAGAPDAPAAGSGISCAPGAVSTSVWGSSCRRGWHTWKHPCRIEFAQSADIETRRRKPACRPRWDSRTLNPRRRRPAIRYIRMIRRKIGQRIRSGRMRGGPCPKTLKRNLRIPPGRFRPGIPRRSAGMIIRKVPISR